MVEQAQKLTGLPLVRDVINFARDKNLNKLIKLGKIFYTFTGSCWSFKHLANDLWIHLDTLLYANKVEKFAINFGIEMK